MTDATMRSTCPACDRDCRRWLECGGRIYVKCRRCGTAHMANPPSAAELEALYGETIFRLPGNDAYYDDDRTNLRAARERRDWIERSVPGGALLDIGCGYGHFLSVLDRQRWDSRGVDVSPHVVHEARQRFGVRCEARAIEQLPRQWHGSLDAVTLWDVIEHVPRPREVIRRAATMLRPGGRLYLSTPDISSPAARLLGRRWHYIDPMQHLTLFSRPALEQMCRRSGLRIAGRRTFGRSYSMDYLLYRAGYSYAIPGLKSAATMAKNTQLARRICIPIKLGDIVAIEAIKS